MVGCKKCVNLLEGRLSDSVVGELISFLQGLKKKKIETV